ncbi:MAG: hypothetical protein ACE15B_19905 [Bryobacteraceae bacterium]
MPPSKKRKKKASEKELVEKALQSIEGKLDADEIKGTMGDLLRLLEFKKQLEDEAPKEVKVTWIDNPSNE